MFKSFGVSQILCKTDLHTVLYVNLQFAKFIERHNDKILHLHISSNLLTN